MNLLGLAIPQPMPSAHYGCHYSKDVIGKRNETTARIDSLPGLRNFLNYGKKKIDELLCGRKFFTRRAPLSVPGDVKLRIFLDGFEAMSVDLQ